MPQLRGRTRDGYLRGMRPRYSGGRIFATPQTAKPHSNFSAGRARVCGRQRPLSRAGARQRADFHRRRVFLTLGLAMWVERCALRHAEVEALKRVYYGLIPLPWLLAALLLANGALDRAPVQLETAKIVGKFSMRGPMPSRRLIVTSWREGRRVERVAVDRRDFDRFGVGDLVEVRVGQGLVGIPWVAGISRP